MFRSKCISRWRESKASKLALARFDRVFTIRCISPAVLKRTMAALSGAGDAGAGAAVASAAAAAAEQAPLFVKFLTEHATAPSRGTPASAGYDLSRYSLVNAVMCSVVCMQVLRASCHECSALAASAYDGVIPARGQTMLKTDLAIAIPEGHYGRIGTMRAVRV